MSRGDANLIIALASLFVAAVAMWAVIYAIRRDRGELRVTGTDAAAGNRYATVVNVGLRPIRIERMVILRPRWILPRPREMIDLPSSAMNSQDYVESELPVVVEPAQDVILHYWPMPIGIFLGPRDDIAVEDAAGHLYVMREARSARHGPPQMPQEG